MPKVITPAQQGAHALGNRVFTPSSKPFQNLRLPDRIDPDPTGEGEGSLLAQAGKFGAEALGAVTKIATAIKKNQDDAAFLNMFDTFSVRMQDRTAAYRAEDTVGPNGVIINNPNVVRGADANKEWLSGFVDDMRADMQKVSESEAFKKLDGPTQTALLAEMQSMFLTNRSKALEWMNTQSILALGQSQLSHITLAAQAVAAAQTLPEFSLAGELFLSTYVENQPSGSNPSAVAVSAGEAYTAQTVIAVENMLNSENFNRIELARQMVMESKKVMAASGLETSLDPNSIIDLEAKIQETSVEGVVMDAATRLYQDFGSTDAGGAEAAYAEEVGVTPSMVKAFRIEYSNKIDIADSDEAHTSHELVQTLTAKIYAGKSLTPYERTGMGGRLDAGTVSGLVELEQAHAVYLIEGDRADWVTPAGGTDWFITMTDAEKNALNWPQLEALAIAHHVSLEDESNIKNDLQTHWSEQRAMGVSIRAKFYTHQRNQKSDNGAAVKAQTDAAIDMFLQITGKRTDSDKASISQLEASIARELAVYNSAPGNPALDGDTALDLINRAITTIGSADTFITDLDSTDAGLNRLTDKERAEMPMLTSLPGAEQGPMVSLYQQVMGIPLGEELDLKEVERFTIAFETLVKATTPPADGEPDNPFMATEEDLLFIKHVLMSESAGVAPGTEIVGKHGAFTIDDIISDDVALAKWRRTMIFEYDGPLYVLPELSRQSPSLVTAATIRGAPAGGPPE